MTNYYHLHTLPNSNIYCLIKEGYEKLTKEELDEKVIPYICSEAVLVVLKEDYDIILNAHNIRERHLAERDRENAELYNVNKGLINEIKKLREENKKLQERPTKVEYKYLSMDNLAECLNQINHRLSFLEKAK